MKLLLHHINRLTDAFRGKAPLMAKRSGHWPTLRASFLKENPACAVCGGTDKLEVHHKHPFHLKPELELEPSNLIVLCESGKNGVNCHLFIGHCGNFRSINNDVENDASTWREKLKNR